MKICHQFKNFNPFSSQQRRRPSSKLSSLHLSTGFSRSRQEVYHLDACLGHVSLDACDFNLFLLNENARHHHEMEIIDKKRLFTHTLGEDFSFQ